MTNEEAIKGLKKLRSFHNGSYGEHIDMAIKALEQKDKVEESNFSTEQYKVDIQNAYDCGYNSGYADAMNDIAESGCEE